MTTRETQDRRLEDLLKRQLAQLLAPMTNPAITDILINQDGSVWYEEAGRGLYRDEGLTIGELVRESIIGTVASMLGIVADREHPIVEGELILERIRFEGLIPPVVLAPTIAMRKPSKIQFTLDDYLRDGIISQEQAGLLRWAIGKRLNIIEDTFELAVTAKNIVQLRATDTLDMTRLLRATMRLRPDKIIVGEVRGGEALAMLKAWNTGHPGGVTTVHANSALGVLNRLGSLVQEAGVPPQPELIADSINLVAFIQKTPLGERKVTDLIQIKGYDAGAGFITSNE
jgi:type IV secretion system protein TrbB